MRVEVATSEAVKPAQLLYHEACGRHVQRLIVPVEAGKLGRVEICIVLNCLPVTLVIGPPYWGRPKTRLGKRNLNRAI